MIHELGLILFSAWVPDYDVEKGEKGCKILLRLGIDFIETDIDVTESCFNAIDDLAGDMFEPEIFSKEIILAIAVYEKLEKHGNQELINKITNWIRKNDEYSHDSDTITYLLDSMECVKSEVSKYGLEVTNYYKKQLLPALEKNINEQIKNTTDFLIDVDQREEFDDEFDLNYDTEQIVKLIHGFERIRPQISQEIKSIISATNDSICIQRFSRIIHNSKFLQKVYGRSNMITTFNELIEFLEKNSIDEFSRIGLSAYGYSSIVFNTKLTKEQIRKLKEIGRRYELTNDVEWEIDDKQLGFMMDSVVYKNKREDMKNLIVFLKEVNDIAPIVDITTGISFNLRELNFLKNKD